MTAFFPACLFLIIFEIVLAPIIALYMIGIRTYIKTSFSGRFLCCGPLPRRSVAPASRRRGLRESNPRPRFWRPPLYHLTKPPYARVVRMLFLAALGKDEVLAYVLAELFERQLSLNGLLILSRPIHLARRALLTTQSYQIVLAHSNTLFSHRLAGATSRIRTEDLHFTKVLL